VPCCPPGIALDGNGRSRICLSTIAKGECEKESARQESDGAGRLRRCFQQRLDIARVWLTGNERPAIFPENASQCGRLAVAAASRGNHLPA
jgi:hypothetical protein